MARILIIDDSDPFRTLLREILEREGFDVSEAANGDLGISEFHRMPPDLVITDIIMPEKEGIQTIRELKREAPDTKIIAISGGASTTTHPTISSSHWTSAQTEPFPSLLTNRNSSRPSATCSPPLEFSLPL